MKKDAVVNYLGYWTDNGAFYNFNKWIGNTNRPYDPEKETPQSLLVQTLNTLKQQAIPISYIQLDDWWYEG